MKTLGNKWLSLLGGVVFTGLGISFFFDSQRAFSRLGLLVGIVLLVLGAVQIFAWAMAHRREEEPALSRLLLGISTAAFGVVVVCNAAFAQTALLTLFGIWALVMGAIRLITAWQYYHDEVSTWYVPLIAAAVSVIFGVYALLGSGVAQAITALITGGYFVLFGIYSLGEFFLFFRLEHRQDKASGDDGQQEDA